MSSVALRLFAPVSHRIHARAVVASRNGVPVGDCCVSSSATERQSNRTIPRNDLVRFSEIFEQPEPPFASASAGACALASADVATAKADPLAAFSPPTRAWFEASFAEPTPAQAQAWPAIASGEHVLLSAPTGSGKTLAAFLWALDRLGARGWRRRKRDAPRAPGEAYGSCTSRR